LLRSKRGGSRRLPDIAMALNNALAHLNEADDVGKATHSKMQAQTAQLQKMNTDMDQIHGNLDTTEAIVGDMEKSYMQYLTESGLSMLGIDCSTKVQSKINDSVPSLKEGWLTKRGPMYGYAWEARWCALYEEGLLWFADETRSDKKGEFDIRKSTKSFGFTKNKAPGDAIKHRGERPFGFVVDVTPNAGPGKERRLFYFDAENVVNQQAWIEAIDSCARKMKKKDKGDDINFSGANQIDQINDALDGLHDTALSLGVEAKKQAKLVKDVTTKVDSATVRMDGQRERIDKL
jgi:hypothetical protein